MTQLPNQDLQKREGRQEIASSVNQGYDYKHSYLGAGNQRSSGSKPFLGQCKSHNMFKDTLGPKPDKREDKRNCKEHYK